MLSVAWIVVIIISFVIVGVGIGIYFVYTDSDDTETDEEIVLDPTPSIPDPDPDIVVPSYTTRLLDTFTVSSQEAITAHAPEVGPTWLTGATASLTISADDYCFVAAGIQRNGGQSYADPAIGVVDEWQLTTNVTMTDTSSTIFSYSLIDLDSPTKGSRVVLTRTIGTTDWVIAPAIYDPNPTNLPTQTFTLSATLPQTLEVVIVCNATSIVVTIDGTVHTFSGTIEPTIDRVFMEIQSTTNTARINDILIKTK